MNQTVLFQNLTSVCGAMDAGQRQSVGLASLVQNSFFNLCRRRGISSDHFIAHVGDESQGLGAQLCTKLCTMSKLLHENSTNNISSLRQLFFNMSTILVLLQNSLRDRQDGVLGVKRIEERSSFIVALHRDFILSSNTLESVESAIDKFGKSNNTGAFFLVCQLKRNCASLAKQIHDGLELIRSWTVLLINQAVADHLRNHLGKDPALFLPISSAPWWVCGAPKDIDTGIEKQIVESILTLSIKPFLLAVSKLLHENNRQQMRGLLSAIVNGALVTSLSSILASKVTFDEEGLYRLFRIILGIADVVQVCKTAIQLPQSQVFIEDKTPWRDAQLILETLNVSIFERKKGNLYAGGDERMKKWATLAASAKPGVSGTIERLIRSRIRHKGTVFVVLRIDDSLL